MLPPVPKDDRRRRCGMLPTSSRQVALRAFGLQGRAGDEDSVKEHKLTAVLECVIGVGFGWACFAIWKVFIHPLFKPQIDNPTGILIGMGVAIVSGVAAWYCLLGWVRQVRFARISEIYLSTGRCPSCGYGIADVPADGDRCVVCPECAAAWNDERVGRDADEPADR